MAAAAQELRYRKTGYTDGSLAHDLDWAVLERELSHAGETPRHQEQEVARPQSKVQTQAKVLVRERQRVAPLTVLGFSAAIVMAVMVLLCCIQLTALSAETVTLKSQLSVLKTEHVTLTAEYERMFDLASVKEAAENAGMTKPGTSQICYIDLSESDNAVVYQFEEPGVLARTLTSLRHGVYAVVEYFD